MRELSEQLHVAEGTVKRAYDELERDGLLIKTPGRGSFVCYHRTADRRLALTYLLHFITTEGNNDE